MITKIISSEFFNPFKQSKSSFHDSINAYTLRWIIKGNLNFTINDKPLTLSSGQIFITNKNDDVSLSTVDNEEIIYAVTSFDGDISLLKNLPVCKTVNLSPFDSDILFQYFYTSNQFKIEEITDNFKDYLISLLNSFLLRIDILNSKNKKLVFIENSKINTQLNDQGITLEIKNYLNNNLYTNVTLKELADSLGVSANTAMHVFRKNVGEGIMSYFTRIKIEKSMKLIIEGELSFRSISEKLGFNSPEYFSRVFKKQTGLTPTEYAKQQNKWSGCLASLYM